MNRLRREVVKVFDHVDLIVLPARRSYTGKLEDFLKAQAAITAESPLPRGFGDHSTPFSVFGLPAMCVPCGFTKEGLPVGIQIVGPHWGEARVFALGRAFEQATEWHKRRPPLANTVAVNSI
ncbi:MAG TPA: amidase family protein [Pyrinomonadaceae bacterium]